VINGGGEEETIAWALMGCGIFEGLGLIVNLLAADFLRKPVSESGLNRRRALGAPGFKVFLY
jgi:hypothetical protein